MDDTTNDLNLTSFDSQCALCQQYIDPQGADSFFAVSSCHPDPGPALWNEVKGLLYVGNTKAGRFCRYDELPGVYLVHRCCNDIIMAANNHRSLFDCLRALGPVLHELPVPLRSWPWLSSCITYAPILSAIISGTDADLEPVRRKIQKRLARFKLAMEWLPSELLEMVLDYIPLELVLALEYLGGRGRWICLHRVRQDPVTSRLERASQILGHRTRQVQRYRSEIKLDTDMVAQFLEVSGHWYLQDLYPNGRQEEGQLERTKQLSFTHDYNRVPYIAVQVNEFGITHIGFRMEAGRVEWISPNKTDEKADFFQDTGSAKRYDSVSVLSDGLKFCTVDIPQQDQHLRTRAILPPGLSTCYWSLSPYSLLYVRPAIIGITKSHGVYIWTPPKPGLSGFRISNSPELGYRELKFSSEVSSRTVELVSSPFSPAVFIRFPESNVLSSIDGAILQVVPHVVAVWYYQEAYNVIYEQRT